MKKIGLFLSISTMLFVVKSLFSLLLEPTVSFYLADTLIITMETFKRIANVGAILFLLLAILLMVYRKGKKQT